MPDVISVPQWANALFQILDQESCQAPITPKVEDGTIKPSSSLLYDLGIGSPKLQVMVDKINGVIKAYRAADADGGLIDTATLGNVGTIGELVNDVYSHLGSVGGA